MLGTAITAAPIEIAQCFAQCCCGHALVFRIYRGINLKALRVRIFTIFFIQFLARHFRHIQCTLVDLLNKALIMQFLRHRLRFLLRRDHAQFLHIVQDIGLAQFSALGIDHRVESRRRLRQARQHRCFCQGQLLHRLIEVNLSGRRKTIGPLAEINLIEIQF